MYKKDYIQRQFEDFGKVLASLLQLRRAKNWEEFEKEISNAFVNFIPVAENEVEKMDTRSFKDKVVNSNDLPFRIKKILASLLFEKMNAALESNNEQRYRTLHEKCLMLYEKIQNDQTENEFDLDVHYKLKMLRD